MKLFIQTTPNIVRAWQFTQELRDELIANNVELIYDEHSEEGYDIKLDDQPLGWSTINFNKRRKLLDWDLPECINIDHQIFLHVGDWVVWQGLGDVVWTFTDEDFKTNFSLYSEA